MSISKELVELTELYKNIQLQEMLGADPLVSGGNKDKKDKKTDTTGEKIDKKKNLDTKDKKEDEKEKKDGNVIVNNNSSSEVKTDDKKDDKKEGNKTYHGTDRSGRDFDDPEADSDVKGGSKERKPINQDIKGSDGKVIGKKTINPSSPDYQKTFEKPKNVNTKELPPEVTKGKEKEIEKANTEKKVEVKPEVKPEVKKTEADYIGKAQGLPGREKWLKDTANSPAARSGAFTDDQRWAQQEKHRKWQQDNNRGAFKVKKEKAKVYTNKVDAFLNNKKVGDPKGTFKGKILSPLEQEMESFEPKKPTEGFDAYDSVMNYLIGTDQVETVEEANYVMMEMDGKTIMEIKKIMNESVVNRADVMGGTRAAKNAQQGIGKYTPGPGVTDKFQLDPNFKIKA